MPATIIISKTSCSYFMSAFALLILDPEGAPVPGIDILLISLPPFSTESPLPLTIFPSVSPDLSFQEIFCGYKLWFGLSHFTKNKEPFPPLHEYTDQGDYHEGQLMPNAWRILFGAIMAFEELGEQGQPMMVNDFRCCYAPKMFELGFWRRRLCNLVWGDPDSSKIGGADLIADDLDVIIKAAKKKAIEILRSTLEIVEEPVDHQNENEAIRAKEPSVEDPTGGQDLCKPSRRPEAEEPNDVKAVSIWSYVVSIPVRLAA
ncbi:hypothetical protein RHSIM_Rhsim11G0012300 [Rhododendron simsii]|uniref:Uncharacterized protein n=1 Tax=Rhododendron simsii TaxID=118357 RepID=A0A834LAH9_RHOSS|nr:hypothetical protein RHSIM_Rhsim11G0012300 [Rhododendron simsii]